MHKTPAENADALLAELAELRHEAEAVLQPLVVEFADILAAYEGQNLGDIHHRKIVSRSIQDLANLLNVKFACPKTGLQATLCCKRSGNAKEGTFELRISVDGRRTVKYSTTSFPNLRPVAMSNLISG